MYISPSSDVTVNSTKCYLFSKDSCFVLHGILQARILEWVAILSSRGSSQPSDWTQVSCTAGRFFTIWVTKEAQEYWSGEPIPSSVDLPDPGIEPGSPALQVNSLPDELPGKPRYKPIFWCYF